MKKLLLISALLLITSCSMQPRQLSAVDHYQACSHEYSDFVKTVNCGKTSRNTSCRSNNSCSSRGNTFVAYADMLADAVLSNEITDARAKYFLIKTAEQYKKERSEAIDKALDSIIKLGESVQEEVDAKNAEHRKRNNKSTNPEDCKVVTDLFGKVKIKCQ